MPNSRYFVLGLAILILPPCFGKEAVYLKTGFSFEAESHTRQAETFVFRLGTGTLEFSSGEVLRIEPLPDAEIPQPTVLSSAEMQTPESILNQAAYLQGLDENFVRSVAKVESGLRQEAVSRKGAIGLMQLMPATAAELGVRADRAPENAKGGAKYLRDLLIRYHGNSALALAAYNAGPEAVARYGGVPPYPETRRYVLLVLREYDRELKAKARPASAARPSNTPSATN